MKDEMRLRIVRTIWRSTIAAFAISIPLVAVIGGPTAILIPLSIAASAAFSTVAVWAIGRTRAASPPAALAEKIKELDRRLGNLELIESTAFKLANRPRSRTEEIRRDEEAHGLQSARPLSPRGDGRE
jgi:hypothetical protein